jgi:AcrR family transcriptional regulator
MPDPADTLIAVPQPPPLVELAPLTEDDPEDKRKDEPREWRARSHAMAQARAAVAQELGEVLQREGCDAPIAEQLRAFIVAHRQPGEPDWRARREASFALALSTASYAGRLDVEHPWEDEPGPRAAA